MDAHSAKPQRVVQISDPHLEREFGGTLLGMNTDASLRYVLDRIHAEQDHIDALLATGDISTYGNINAYRRFREYLQEFDVVKAWLPGNHDSPAVMAEVIEHGEELNGVVRLDHWQIIMLNSTIPREVGGRISEDEIARMQALVAEAPHLNAMVCCHHPPLPVHCAWLDPQRIANSERFLLAARALPQVKLIVCGHVHQHWETEFEGLPVMSTPSTCVQFKPLCDDFQVDTINPGYRWFDLYPDGRFETSVSRVENVTLEVDINSQGY